MSKPAEKKSLWKILWLLPFGGLTFFFFPSCYGQSQSKFADSIAFYDHVLSFQSLLPLDSQIMISRKAEAYAKGHGETYKSYVYAVRRGALYFSLDSNARCEELNKRLIPEIEERVAMDPSPQWKELLVDCYSNLALSLIYGEKTDSAMRIYQNLYSRFEKDSNTSLRAKCLNGIGATFAYRSYIDVALNYFKHALSEYERARNQRGIYLACSNIGTSYLDQGKYREALPYCTRSYQIAEQEGYHGAESITSAMTMGYIHAGLKQYEIANTYFANALERTLKGNFRHLEGYVTMAYAQSLYQEGNYACCLQLASDGLEKINGEKKYSLQVDFLKLMSRCSEKMNDDSQALAYLRQAVMLSDSSFAVERDQSLLQLELEYNHYRHEQERIASQNELIVSNLKATNRMLWIFGLSGALVLLISIIVFISRRFSKEKKQSIQIQEDSRKQLQIADETIAQKNKELASNALRFLRLNNLQNAILENLKKLKTAFAMRGKEKIIVCEIENLAKQIASEKEYKDFEFYFEQVDKEFLTKLAKVCPDLTANERHLCVLFNLGLSNRDVANLTGRTLQSVGMAKFRLKNKLKLENSEDITTFLQSLDYPMPPSPAAKTELEE